MLGAGNAAYLELSRHSEDVDEDWEVLAELWVEASRQWCRGEQARARRSEGGAAAALRASGGSEGEARARAGELRGSRALSTSSRPARGVVRPSQARGGHVAAIL